LKHGRGHVALLDMRKYFHFDHAFFLFMISFDLTLLFFFLLHAFVKSLLIYSYLRKVSNSKVKVESLRKKLAKAEWENAKFKETVAKQNEDLLTLGKHLSKMECEDDKASMAKDRVEARLAKLSEKFKSLQAEL
jgi:septal ring factor EnvC (AmiA/AmiB activator)